MKKNLNNYYKAIHDIISYTLKNNPFEYRTTKDCIKLWNELVRKHLDDCVEAVEDHFEGEAFDRGLALEAIRTYEADLTKLDDCAPIRWN